MVDKDYRVVVRVVIEKDLGRGKVEKRDLYLSQPKTKNVYSYVDPLTFCDKDRVYIFPVSGRVV